MGLNNPESDGGDEEAYVWMADGQVPKPSTPTQHLMLKFGDISSHHSLRKLEYLVSHLSNPSSLPSGIFDLSAGLNFQEGVLFCEHADKTTIIHDFYHMLGLLSVRFQIQDYATRYVLWLFYTEYLLIWNTGELIWRLWPPELVLMLLF
jgi:hypothetical protein